MTDKKKEIKAFMHYVMNAPVELSIRNAMYGKDGKTAAVYDGKECVAMYVFASGMFIINERAKINQIKWYEQI